MQEEIVELMSGTRGHFRFESGHHGELWLELDSMFVRPGALSSGPGVAGGKPPSTASTTPLVGGVDAPHAGVNREPPCAVGGSGQIGSG